MSKNVAAINISSREQFGESQYLSKYSNQLVELMKPVALQANKSLYGEQYQAIANRFQALVSAKVIDEATAEKLTNSSFEMYMNPYNTIANGNTFQKYVGINTYANGDIDNPASWVENTLAGINYSYGMVGNDTMNQSIMYNTWGIPVNGRNWNNANYKEAMIKLASINSLSEEELERLFESEKSKADNYNTNSQKLDTALLNATTDISEIKTVITNKGWEIGKVIVGGITTWLGAKLLGGSIGKLASNLLGSGANQSGGAGLMSLLSTNGVALGAFGSAAGIVLSGIIANGIVNAKAKEMGKNIDYYEATGQLDKYNLTDENGNVIELSSAAKELLAGGLDNKGSEGWGGYISDAFDFIGEYKANPFMGWGVSRKDRNQAIFAKEMNLLGATSLDEKDLAKARLAWLMIADASHVISDIDGWSSDKIKEAFKFIYNDDGDAQYWVDWIQKWGNFYNPQISTDAGKTTTYLVPNSYTQYHRYGLDTVPYDNYVASLHEGEAILTASTANELRNLLDEYRNNNQSSANLEAIVQQQTNDLCNKLDEVVIAISRLNTNNGVLTASAIDQAKAQNLLKNSMLHMKSTKNALN